MGNLTIRLEHCSDYKKVEQLTFEAFETMQLPGRTHTDEHFLAHIIRKSPEFLPEFDFIGLIDGEIVANIMYTKSKVVRADGNEVATVTFGPVSVNPKLHKQGIGSKLIQYSIDHVRECGFGAIIIVGHPTYYPRFGFKPASEYNLTMPDSSSFDAFMALELQPDYLGKSGGKWYESDVFDINENEFNEWNSNYFLKNQAED